jgi:hypothetical protein
MRRSSSTTRFPAVVPIALGFVLSALVPETARGQFPPYVWSARFGGDGKTCDEGRDVAADGHGNAIITGSFEGTVDFGGGPLAAEGYTDVFVVELDAGGMHVWSRRFGDAGGYASGEAVAADGEGGIFVAGKFGGTVDFGGGPLSSAGNSDAFLLKLDDAGEHVWSRRFGGSDVDIGTGVAVDGDGGVIAVGQFRGTVDFGGEPLQSAGNHDVFVAKFSPGGAHLWSRRFGGAAMDLGEAVAARADGGAIFAGSFQDAVDFGGGPLQSAGYHDIFLTRLDAGGGHVWSRRFGGALNDHGHGVAVDGEDNVLVTGEFRGTVDFGGGPLSSAGNEDIFIARYDPGGAHLWSRRLGDAYFAQAGFDVAAAADGGVVATGWFWGSVDLGGGPLQSAGEKDIFVAGYDSEGGYLWGGRFGGTGWDAGFGIAADNAGNTLLAGAFEVSVDFGGGLLVNPGGASFGCTDACAAKFGPVSVWIDGPDRLDSQHPGEFAARVSGGTLPYAYRWYESERCEGDSWREIGDDAPRLAVASRSSFCVKVVVTDGAGESASRTHRVRVPPERLIPLHRTAAALPAQFTLGQNVPNPFNPVTRISFDLPAVSGVSLVVYDVRGSEVAALVDALLPGGRYTVSFDAGDLPSGIYFYRLVAGEHAAVKKMVLVE